MAMRPITLRMSKPLITKTLPSNRQFTNTIQPASPAVLPQTVVPEIFLTWSALQPCCSKLVPYAFAEFTPRSEGKLVEFARINRQQCDHRVNFGEGQRSGISVTKLCA